MKKFTVAIAGCGARGYHTYAQYQKKSEERMQIVALADINKEKLELAKNEFNVKDEMCFSSAEEMLDKGKLADVIIIATQDQDHKRHALKAISLGYDILLEKPVSNNPLDCLEIRDAAIKHDSNITVCHVLRYTTFYKTIKQIIKSGVIGDVCTVAAFENVGYWHQAHSFIRGNWRNSNQESPMILQKCCHDFDIINWLLEKECISLSSYGSLKYFNEAHAPEGSSTRCYNCKCNKDCVFDAYKIYISNFNGIEKGNKDWPVNIIMENPTLDGVKEKLKTSQYGRCVFHCDNNVVDHQIVNMQYEDDITVSLTMTGFTSAMSRQIRICGTKGEIVADQEPNTVTIRRFGEKDKVIDINKIATDLSGHGGGDNEMMKEMFDALENHTTTESSIKASISSHIQAFASEYSRTHQGLTITIKDFEKIVEGEQ